MADDRDPDDDTPAETADEKLIKKARQCYAAGVAAMEKQVQREKDDLRCQVPDLIWPTEVLAARGGQVIDGVSIPARPNISIPSLDQPVQLVLNQEKAAHLGVQIHALSEDADDETAEILQGLYRRIEVDSRAGLARSWAYERAVKAGRGAYRVLTEYADDGGHFTDQKIVIRRILHQESAVFDPFAQEPDWSDGKWAFVTQWVRWADYKRDYPDTELAKYGKDSDDPLGFFDTMPETQREAWINGEGETRAVLVAEYFYLDYQKRTRVQFDDESDGYEDDIPEGRTVKKDGRTRTEQIPKLHWCKLNGAEVLEQREMDGKFIPIIPVVGKELQPFDDERRWVGVYGPNKDAARLLNYAASGAIEMAALETKAPYIMYEGQDEGYERMWQQANVRAFPALKVNKNVTLPGGVPAPLPQRSQVDSSRLGPSMMLLGMSREFIQSGTGAFRETLGQADPSNQTKGGILALQDQHLRGNSHYLDNLAQISITYEAKVVLDLIPYVYDRPGRVARILDLEDNAKTVMLNKPFEPGQNKRPVPLPESPETEKRVANQQDPARRYDLKKGTYGVLVSVGKARESRLEEGSTGIGAIMQAVPGLIPVLGPVWAKYQDFPGHTEIESLMKKMRDQQFPFLKDEQEQGDPRAELQKLQQAMQMMQQQLQAATQALQTDQVKAQADVEKVKIKAMADAQVKQAEFASKLDMQRMDNATKLAIAHINAAAKGAAIDAHAAEEALALGHEMQQAELDRSHEVGMAALSGQQAMDGAQQGQDHALEMQALQPPTNGNGGAA